MARIVVDQFGSNYSCADWESRFVDPREAEGTLRPPFFLCAKNIYFDKDADYTTGLYREPRTGDYHVHIATRGARLKVVLGQVQGNWWAHVVRPIIVRSRDGVGRVTHAVYSRRIVNNFTGSGRWSTLPPYLPGRACPLRLPAVCIARFDFARKHSTKHTSKLR